MNAVGVDVSKGKSTVAILRPFGEVVVSPFEVMHTESELQQLVDHLTHLNGETKVIMEYTGSYYQPIAHALREAGIFVSAVHPQLTHRFGNNTIRKMKTDKADAIKIANYGLSNWMELSEYTPEEDIRRVLKIYSRQYNKYSKLKTMLKNNLISLTDQTFPGVNELFSSVPRKSDGHQKWIDFTAKFWHCECVCNLSQNVFTERYRKWCKRAGYLFSQSKAESIYVAACGHVGVMPCNEITQRLITQAIAQLNMIAETLASVANEMKRLAAMLPEFPIVSEFYGVGDVLAPQLMAEIGDIHRFHHKGSLVCFAGLEAPPYQSGKFESDNRSISKKGSPHLRKALFQVMDCLVKRSPVDEPVYQFIDRKRAEGKHYYNYMTAGSAKFLLSPFIAGFLLTVTDIKMILIIDITTIAVTIPVTMLIKKRIAAVKTQRDNQGFFKDFADGWRVISSNRGLLMMILIISLVTFYIGFLQTLYTPLMLTITDAKTLGIVESISAVGMLVSSILLGVFTITRKYVNQLVVGLMLSGIFIALLGLTTSVFAIAISGFLFFAALPFINTSADVLTRSNIPDDKQGRAWGLIGILSQFGFVIAYAVSGLLADHVFNPLLVEDGVLASTVGRVVGVGNGRGIGFMLIISGILLVISAVILSKIRSIRELERSTAL